MAEDEPEDDTRTSPNQSSRGRGGSSGKRAPDQNRAQGQPTRRNQPGQQGQPRQPNQQGQPGRQGAPGGRNSGSPPQQTRPGQPPGQGPPGGHPQQSDGIDFGGLPWVSGAINGVAYYITAFIIASMVFVGDIITSFDTFDPGSDFFRYGLGWKFYDGHFVNVPQNFSMLNNQLAVPELGYTLIPAVFLFLGGRSVARTHARRGISNEELAAHGATIVAGYLPMALLGATMLKDNGSGPNMGAAALLMGVVFPVVCGGLGGYLARR